MHSISLPYWVGSSINKKSSIRSLALSDRTYPTSVDFTMNECQDWGQGLSQVWQLREGRPGCGRPSRRVRPKLDLSVQAGMKSDPRMLGPITGIGRKDLEITSDSLSSQALVIRKFRTIRFETYRIHSFYLWFRNYRSRIGALTDDWKFQKGDTHHIHFLACTVVIISHDCHRCIFSSNFFHNYCDFFGLDTLNCVVLESE